MNARLRLPSQPARPATRSSDAFVDGRAPGAIRRARVAGRAAVAVAVTALLLGACGGGGGGSGPTPPPGGWLDANSYSADPLASLGAPNETTASTQGSSVVGGSTVAWTATAGHLTANDFATGRPEASFFYVSYVADGFTAGQRPVTFFFNGGPGSSSAWLHLGSFAPKRLDSGVPDNTFPRDFPYVTNDETLIGASDLVFVDAVGTGLSEAIAPFRNNSFWSTDVDAAAMRDFIMRWLAVNQRQASPLYVFGESYGTVRAPIVTRYLQLAGTDVTGLVLQSSILDYNSNCGVTSGAVASITCEGFIPSYAAVGDWLGLVQPAPIDEAAFLADVSTFADAAYAPAARAWLDTGAAPPADTLATLQSDTGLPVAAWQAQFNMDSDTFRHEIVPGSVAGLYDGRIVATLGSPLAANDEPSDTLITAPFTNSIGTVLGSIGYTTPSTYVMLSNAIASWDFTHNNGTSIDSLPDVIPDITAAMIMNPSLKVLSVNGMHDLITPYHQTELDLQRLPSDLTATRLAFRLYQGGHMTYLDDTGRVAESADLKAFYAGTLAATVKTAHAAATPAATPARPHAPAGAMSIASLDGRAVAHPVAVAAPAGARRDPGLPSLAARQAARTTPGVAGPALEALVRAQLRAAFDRADVAHQGRVTLAQARAAGLGAVANHFAEIDAAGRGSVSFDDWMRQLKTR